MRMKALLYFIVIWSIACSSDAYWRVGRANSAAISFLIEYARTQAHSFEVSGRYDDRLTPYGASGLWKRTAQAYTDLEKHRYNCQFNIAGNKFNVRCMPMPSSGLQISFYVDESRTIRLTAYGDVGPSSPIVRLLPDEERELFGKLKER